MAFRHVERVEPTTTDRAYRSPPNPGRTSIGAFGPFTHGDRTAEYSNKTVGHDVWRCGHCGALAVGPIGDQPPKKCGKCHQ